MNDPRKPIERPDAKRQDMVRRVVHGHLMECTEKGSRALGCTGASFVIIGLGIWAAELSELDQKAAAQMLGAMAVLFDPASNDAQKRRAEKKRQVAVDRLFASLDLEMSTPGGSA